MLPHHQTIAKRCGDSSWGSRCPWNGGGKKRLKIDKVIMWIKRVTTEARAAGTCGPPETPDHLERLPATGYRDAAAATSGYPNINGCAASCPTLILTHKVRVLSATINQGHRFDILKNRILPGDRQHLSHVPPHHPLGSFHRNRLSRLHDHEPRLHPLLPSHSRLLDGMHALLPPHLFHIHPPRSSGSHKPRLIPHGRHLQSGFADHHWICLDLWLGRG